MLYMTVVKFFLELLGLLLKALTGCNFPVACFQSVPFF